MGFFTGSDPSLETFSSIQSSQQNVLGDLGGMFRAILEGLPAGLSPEFPNLVDAVPELSNLQNLSLAGFEALALGQPSGTRAGQAVDAARGQIADIFNRGPADFEDFFRTNIEDPALEQFRDRIAPQIRREGVRRGGIFGSAVRDDLGDASENLVDSLTRERGNLAFQTELANRQNVIQAIQLIPGLETLDPTILGMMLQAGGIQQLPAQQQFQALLTMLDEVSRRIGQATGFATASTQGGGTVAGSAGFLGSLAGGLGQGIGELLGQINFGGSGNTGGGDPNPGGNANNFLPFSTGGSNFINIDDFSFGRNSFIGDGFFDSGFNQFDPNQGGFGGQEFCWVAAEYFGWFTPKWRNARRYIMSSPIAALYKKHGRSLARRVRNEPALKAQLRPFFEEAARG